MVYHESLYHFDRIEHVILLVVVTANQHLCFVSSSSSFSTNVFPFDSQHPFQFDLLPFWDSTENNRPLLVVLSGSENEKMKTITPMREEINKHP